jgi:hypothetical protein
MSNQTQDSWESRIEEVAKILGKEIVEVEEILNSDPFKLTQEPNRLEMISDEDITPFGDMRKMFCDENNVTLPQLRMCMRVLRGPKDSVKVSQMDTDALAFNTKFGLETTLEDLEIEQILEFYKPKRKNRIHDVIRERYENSYGPVIAFHPNSQKVAIDETLDYIADLESGLPVEHFIDVDGVPVKLHKVGQTPDESLNEDPLFHNRPLRRGRSTINRINWTDIGLPERQFFRILLDKGLINGSDRLELRKIIRLQRKELIEIFPEAELKFQELDSRGELPKLKIFTGDNLGFSYSSSSTSSSSSTCSSSSRAQDPFATKRNRIK